MHVEVTQHVVCAPRTLRLVGRSLAGTCAVRLTVARTTAPLGLNHGMIDGAAVDLATLDRRANATVGAVPTLGDQPTTLLARSPAHNTTQRRLPPGRVFRDRQKSRVEIRSTCRARRQSSRRARSARNCDRTLLGPTTGMRVRRCIRSPSGRSTENPEPVAGVVEVVGGRPREQGVHCTSVARPSPMPAIVGPSKKCGQPRFA